MMSLEEELREINMDLKFRKKRIKGGLLNFLEFVKRKGEGEIIGFEARSLSSGLSFQHENLNYLFDMRTYIYNEGKQGFLTGPSNFYIWVAPKKGLYTSRELNDFLAFSVPCGLSTEKVVNSGYDMDEKGNMMLRIGYRLYSEVIGKIEGTITDNRKITIFDEHVLSINPSVLGENGYLQFNEDENCLSEISEKETFIPLKRYLYLIAYPDKFISKEFPELAISNRPYYPRKNNRFAGGNYEEQGHYIGHISLENLEKHRKKFDKKLCTNL